VQVLKAGQVSPDDDQVHALGVLDLEVAHGVAGLADDAEAQVLGYAACQLGVVDDKAQAASAAASPRTGIAAPGSPSPAMLIAPEPCPPFADSSAGASGSATLPAARPAAKRTASTAAKPASFASGFKPWFRPLLVDDIPINIAYTP
jgi:hypothetical protein